MMERGGGAEPLRDVEGTRELVVVAACGSDVTIGNVMRVDPVVFIGLAGS